MKLFRWGDLGKEKLGAVLANGKQVDISAFGEDLNEQFFATEGLKRLGIWLKTKGESAPEIPKNVRFGSAVARPSKIICIGLNYRDHARETKAAIPTEPIIFFKSTSALCGPNDALIIPRNAQKADWEVELAVIIGKRASYVDDVKTAGEYIAGYALHNDYSERAFQLERGGQWVKGKSADSFAPLGPYLVTADEVADIGNLKMWLKVNGVIKQNGTTADMIFNVNQLVSYVSQFMTLLPGDIISTGTPAGVGLGMNPPQFVQPGDLIQLGIDGLGESQQSAVAWQAIVG